MESKNRCTVKDFMLMEVGAPYQLINYELVYTPSRSIKHQLELLPMVGGNI